MFFFQALLLLAIFGVLGAIVGCLLRRMIGVDDTVPASASRGTGAAPAPVAQPRVTAAPAAAESPKPATAPAAKLPAPEPVAFEPAPAAASEPAGLMATPAKAKAPAKPKAPAKAKPAAKEPAKTGRAAKPKAPEAKPAAKAKAADKTAKAPSKPKTLTAARRGKPDNLTLINGIGNALEKRLNALGYYHFDQLAAWTPAQADSISREIGFPGRVQRENWIGEAKVFAKGGTTEHAKKVEKGEVATSRKSSARKK